MTLITGNTYPVKSELRDMGGIWNKAQKGWIVPDEVAEAARALVGSAATHYKPSHAPRVSRYRSNHYRFAGGGECYVNKRGRCEDAPCCGCCS